MNVPLNISTKQRPSPLLRIGYLILGVALIGSPVLLGISYLIDCRDTDIMEDVIIVLGAPVGVVVLVQSCVSKTFLWPGWILIAKLVFLAPNLPVIGLIDLAFGDYIYWPPLEFWSFLVLPTVGAIGLVIAFLGWHWEPRTAVKTEAPTPADDAASAL